MFTDKHFQVKIKKDEKPTDQPMVVHHLVTAEEVTDIVDKIISAIVVGAVMYKASNALFRMAEHIVVTKVK